MDPTHFRHSPTGKVIQVGRGEFAYHAFVPHPLPPTYTPTIRLMNVLSEADRALGELAGMSNSLVNPLLFLRPFMRREAVLSSRIEGTQADIADLYAYEASQLTLPGKRSLSSERDVQEVYNYVQALEYGLERLDTLPLSLRFLCELHERLLDGVQGEHATPGVFRRSQNWIGPPGSSLANAPFVPAPVDEMREALYALELYLHQPEITPPLIRLAFIHYQFEAIHPFIDGNGRIGRLLITLLLVHWNLLPLPLLYLSAYFEKKRQTYYDLLLAVSKHGAWDKWLTFFLSGVAEQARDANSRTRQIQQLQNQWLSMLQQPGFTGLMSGVTNILFEQPIITARDVCKQFNVSHTTAMRTLRRLEKLGILIETTGQARNQRFIADRLVKLMG